VVRTATVAFPDPSSEEAWSVVSLGLDDVERIRMDVVAYHGLGGGISEVRIE
jgi:hypothetical protein